MTPLLPALLLLQAAPAPRFSRTPSGAPGPVLPSDVQALLGWGIDEQRVRALADASVIA